MNEVIKHPFCQRRHPSFPTDALFLASPPELIDIKKVLASRGGMDDTAFQSLQVLLPDADVGDLYRALHMPEWVSIPSFLSLLYRQFLLLFLVLLAKQTPAPKNPIYR